MFRRTAFLAGAAASFTQVGQLLADRLYGKGTEQMDYSLVATAVFTPVSEGILIFSRRENDAQHSHDGKIVPSRDSVCVTDFLID